jgi:hypothetical protein
MSSIKTIGQVENYKHLLRYQVYSMLFGLVDKATTT